MHLEGPRIVPHTENPDIFSMEYGLALHAACVAQEPDALEKLADHYYFPLIDSLRRRNSQWRDLDDFGSAAADAFVSYLKRPDVYDPTRGHSLFKFFVFAAQRDFMNIIKGQKPHNNRQTSIIVENADNGSEYELPISDGSDDQFDQLLSDIVILDQLNVLLDDKRDIQCVNMMMDRVRDRKAFADIYGLSHLPPEEQEHEIKKHKDRIKKQLLRKLDREEFHRHD